MSSNPCRPGALHELLSSDSHSPDLVAHVGQCQRCQQELDALAGAPEFWRETQLLAKSVATNVPDLPPADTLILAKVEACEQVPSTSLSDVAGHLAPPRHPEMLGSIGKYDVYDEVGRGGMSIVLKGFDRELNRPVAVKLLAPHLASSGVARQRFIREARAAAAVVHDNVVAIHDIHSEGTLPAIVMPLIGGSSLHQYVERNGPFDVVDVVRIGVQIAAGLAAAHAQGLVHRDIKPANILLQNGVNRVQITDFGLARAAHDANLTRSGVITGTPHFMSPEQAIGGSIDHRSDLFSLGSVLYFVATGEFPFSASTPMGVLQRVCTVTPQPVRELNSAVPLLLQHVIEKLIEKNPADRFQSADQLRIYLNEVLAHLQQPSRPAPRGLVTSAVRQRRRRRLQGTIGLIVASIIALWCWARYEPAGDRPEPPNAVMTFHDLGVNTELQLEQELFDLHGAVLALENTAAGNGPRPTLAPTETFRANWASEFDSQVFSIDAGLRQLEQNDRASPISY